MIVKIILIFILYIIILTLAYAGLKGAPWIPTKAIDLDRVLKLAQIKPGQIAYDLGCGDGRLVLALAEAGAQARGLELSILFLVIALMRKFFHEKRGFIHFSWRDFWRVNLRDADVVYAFLTPKANAKLKNKFDVELKKGTKIITYVWPINGWPPVKVDVCPGRPNLYLYEIS